MEARKVDEIFPEEEAKFNRTERNEEEYISYAKTIVNKGLDTREKDLIDSFQSGPLLDLYLDMLTEGKSLSVKEALQVDLTDYLLLDFLWRYHNNADAALNIMGDARIGKSNMLLWSMLNWCRISGATFRLSNVVFNRVEYNYLLKGYKIKEIPKSDDITLEDYKFQRGDSLGLDEGADVSSSGNLMMTTIMQSKDIEARMAAMQVMRAAAGVGTIFHSSHFDIHALKRIPSERICVGLLVKQPKIGFDMTYLGAVSIPYVDKTVFDAYEKPKMKSIGDYGRSSDTRRLAKIKGYLVKKLWNREEFQSLPMKPIDMRVNWLQEREEFSLYPTATWYENIVKLSRNMFLYATLVGDIKLLNQLAQQEEIRKKIAKGGLDKIDLSSILKSSKKSAPKNSVVKNTKKKKLKIS